MPGFVSLLRARGARRCSPPPQAGFLLPLALTVALLLMLSSLLLLTLALQSRLQAAVQRQRRLAEDQLMNAAQQWAGRVQRQCPEALAGGPLCGGLEAGEGYRLVSYAPGGDSDQGTGDLVLELRVAEAPLNGARGAFALHWQRPSLPPAEAAGVPPRLLGIEERGLRAAAGTAG
ncbi:MAG: hypothetical protein AB1Z21_04500, partial [Synechococcaceae cyanobacterium]